MRVIKQHGFHKAYCTGAVHGKLREAKEAIQNKDRKCQTRGSKMRRPLVLCALTATSALAWAPPRRHALPHLRPGTIRRSAPVLDAPLPPPPLVAKLAAKVKRAVPKPGWRGAAAVGAGAVACAWGCKGALGAFLSKSFLGDALATLLRAGARRDALAVLLAFAVAVPGFKSFGASPVLAFLASGALLGPHGLAVISDVGLTQRLADLGVCFFLFEMGLELSFGRLKALRRELGLGAAQVACTSVLLAKLGGVVGLGGLQAAVVGSALALSSSAFALRLLRDRDDLATAHGRAALGVLLAQNLAVVPLLAAIPCLGKSAMETTVTRAVAAAAAKGVIALATVELVGKRVVDALFFFAARSRSQEAFLAVVLLNVLGIASITECVGLPAALGALLAGASLSQTRYRYQIEADVAPFRGVLLGLFFATVGFSVDFGVVAARPRAALAATLGLVAAKALALVPLGLIFKLPAAAAARTGLLLAPAGEFGFVAIGLAKAFRVLDAPTARLLTTAAALSMCLTPALAQLGDRLAEPLDRLEARWRKRSRRARDDAAVATAVAQSSGDLVVVVGFGRVGRVVCELLDAKLQRYVVFDLDPYKATEARQKGKPVFFGDLGRPEVLEYFGVGAARLVVVAIADKRATNRVVVALRRLYPDLEIIARARDSEHQRRLNKMLGVVAMVPTLPEDSRLLSLPFGGAVLRALNYKKEDVDGLIEESRRSALGLFDGVSETLVAEEQATLLEQLGVPGVEEAEAEVAV